MLFFLSFKINYEEKLYKFFLENPMDKKSFIFSIDQSIIFKVNDINYKVGIYSKKLPICVLRTPLFKVRFLIISLENYVNSNLFNSRSLAGFCLQVYEVNVFRISKILGFPSEIEKINFFQSKLSKILDYFFCYCSDTGFQKFTPAGLVGKFFFFFRFFILDMFGFFGGEFYESFYINYFGFSEVFAFDFFFNFIGLKAQTKNPEQRILQIKNFLSFLKISLDAESKDYSNLFGVFEMLF